ncbi:uncharacterized protein LOC132200987 isoform X2 [Neocloeon triangulifer]|nr:uncharacterized protein LOC132200987 isoform X2 [Neocloeon triangulifer]XP_059482827.1 uncharacterized protein LOC132200987 isoform X2 [Neocloeon triangulifer]
MNKHGCSSSKKIDQALILYMYLCEEMRAWEITHSYSPDHDLIYISAKLQESSNFNVFVPVDLNADVSPQTLCALQNELGDVSEGDLNHSKRSLKLAFIGSDSTVLIHDMIQGVAPYVPRERKKVDPETLLAPAVLRYINEQEESIDE